MKNNAPLTTAARIRNAVHGKGVQTYGVTENDDGTFTISVVGGYVGKKIIGLAVAGATAVAINLGLSLEVLSTAVGHYGNTRITTTNITISLVAPAQEETANVEA